MSKSDNIVLILPRENSITYKNSYRESANVAENVMKIASQDNYEVFREPLGIESIAAYLRDKNYSVKMFFCEMEDRKDEDICRYIADNNVKFIGFSVIFDRHLEHALRLSMKLISAKAEIFFGGAFASFAAAEIVEKVDWISGVLLGEGEKTVYNIIEKIYRGEEWKKVKGICFSQKGQKAIFTEKEDKLDINQLPPPARDYLEKAIEKGYGITTASIYTSRGCAQSCTFCTGNQFTKFNKGKAWRYKTAEVVVDEIEMLVKKYGIQYFYICDDNFFGYGNQAKDRIYNIVRLLNEKELKVQFHFEMRVDMVTDELLAVCKSGGFLDIFLGIESGVQSMLDRWKKSSTVEQNLIAIQKVRESGLRLNPGFILYDEKTTFEELKENLNFIRMANLDSSEYIFDLFNPMQIFIGSTLQKSGNYASRNNVDAMMDEIKKLVINITKYDYEIQDKRVYIFWEIIRDIIDETNYYFNYYIIPTIYNNKKLYIKSKLMRYLSNFQKMRNNMGKILMDVSFFAVDIVDNIEDIEILKESVRNYYTKIENKYFQNGVKRDLEKAMINRDL